MVFIRFRVVNIVFIDFTQADKDGVGTPVKKVVIGHISYSYTSQVGYKYTGMHRVIPADVLRISTYTIQEIKEFHGQINYNVGKTGEQVYHIISFSNLF